MRYDKNVQNGYITAISVTDNGAAEDGTLTASEYAELHEMICARPTPQQDGYGYRLNAATLLWEEYALPQITAYTEAQLLSMTNAELERILFGFGITASMNKANLIRLILAAQGGGEE